MPHNVIIICLCGTAEKCQRKTAAGGKEDLIFLYYIFILSLTHTHAGERKTLSFSLACQHLYSSCYHVFSLFVFSTLSTCMCTEVVAHTHTHTRTFRSLKCQRQRGAQLSPTESDSSSALNDTSEISNVTSPCSFEISNRLGVIRSFRSSLNT